MIFRSKEANQSYELLKKTIDQDYQPLIDQVAQRLDQDAYAVQQMLQIFESKSYSLGKAIEASHRIDNEMSKLKGWLTALCISADKIF
jgi:AcrR family transcriptional regulator